MAIDSSEEPRHVAYPLYNSADRNADQPVTGDADIFVWETDDPDETVLINLELTLNEYVALATAIDVGRDIAFNADSYLIWWIWVKAYKMVEWCAHIIECIESDAGTQAALGKFINQNDNLPVPMKQSDLDREIASGFNPECDYDIIWAQSVALVTRTNTAIVDVLESFSEADTLTKVFSVLAELPIVENVGLSSISDLANFIFNVGISAYTDAYDTTYAETLECAIFCLSKDDCKITFNTVWSIFRSRVESAIPEFAPPGNWLDVTQWFNSLSVYVSELAMLNAADVMFYFIFGGLAIGDYLLLEAGNGQRIFDVALALAADEPSNNWETLCLDCGWEYEFNTDATWAQWTINDYYGAVAQIVDNVMVGQNTTNSSGQLSLYIQIAASTTVQHIEIDVEWQNDGLNPPPQSLLLYAGASLLATQDIADPDTGTATLEWTGAQSGTITYYVLGSLFGDTANGDYLNITAIRMSGVGTNPFI